MPPELLTTNEVADLFKVSQASVRHWIRSGALPAIRTPGGRGNLRVRQSDIDVFLARLETPDGGAA